MAENGQKIGRLSAAKAKPASRALRGERGYIFFSIRRQKQCLDTSKQLIPLFELIPDTRKNQHGYGHGHAIYGTPVQQHYLDIVFNPNYGLRIGIKYENET